VLLSPAAAVMVAAQVPVIVDHRSTTLAAIPTAWIQQAKATPHRPRPLARQPARQRHAASCLKGSLWLNIPAPAGPQLRQSVLGGVRSGNLTDRLASRRGT
jgi:hypothetical protein